VANQVMMDCSNCGKSTMHVQPSTSHVLHLLLSLITFGAWIVVWLIIAANNKSQATCIVCGQQVGLFGSTRGGAKGIKPISDTHVRCPDCVANWCCERRASASIAIASLYPSSILRLRKVTLGRCVR